MTPFFFYNKSTLLVPHSSAQPPLPNSLLRSLHAEEQPALREGSDQRGCSVSSVHVEVWDCARRGAEDRWAGAWRARLREAAPSASTPVCSAAAVGGSAISSGFPLLVRTRGGVDEAVPTCRCQPQVTCRILYIERNR